MLGGTLVHFLALRLASFVGAASAVGGILLVARGEVVERVGVSGHFSANEATTLMRAALAGGGIAMQPTYLVNPYLHSGELQVVLPGWELPVMTIYALYPSRRHLSPAVRALLDFLVARFAGVPW